MIVPHHTAFDLSREVTFFTFKAIVGLPLRRRSILPLRTVVASGFVLDVCAGRAAVTARHSVCGADFPSGTFLTGL